MDETGWYYSPPTPDSPTIELADWETAQKCANGAKGTVKDDNYIIRSIKAFILGDFSSADPTELSVAGGVAAGFFDADLPFDFRDLVYDVSHTDELGRPVLQIGVDIIAFLPVIGASKYVDDIAALLKRSDDLTDAAKTAEKAAEAADGLKDAEKAEKAVDKAKDVGKQAEKELSGEWKEIDPNSIRYSQSSVNGTSEIADSMKQNGWIGDPIDVVEMPDGNLTTVDNTRVVAAREAGIKVEANVHKYNDPLPEEYIERFSTKKGETPKTWGDAINNRIANQNGVFRNNNPYGSYEMNNIK